MVAFMMNICKYVRCECLTELDELQIGKGDFGMYKSLWRKKKQRKIVLTAVVRWAILYLCIRDITNFFVILINLSPNFSPVFHFFVKAGNTVSKPGRIELFASCYFSIIFEDRFKLAYLAASA